MTTFVLFAEIDQVVIATTVVVVVVVVVVTACSSGGKQSSSSSSSSSMHPSIYSRRTLQCADTQGGLNPITRPAVPLIPTAALVLLQ